MGDVEVAVAVAVAVAFTVAVERIRNWSSEKNERVPKPIQNVWDPHISRLS